MSGSAKHTADRSSRLPAQYAIWLLEARHTSPCRQGRAAGVGCVGTGLSKGMLAYVLHAGKAAAGGFTLCYSSLKCSHGHTLFICTGDLAIIEHSGSIEIPPGNMVISQYEGPGSQVLKRLVTTPVSTSCILSSRGVLQACMEWSGGYTPSEAASHLRSCFRNLVCRKYSGQTI